MKLNLVDYQNQLVDRMAAATGVSVGMDPIRIAVKDKVFNIDAQWVDFIESLPTITRIPQTDKFVLGSCHSRGRVFMVLDLALALGEIEATPNSKLIAFKGRDLALSARLATPSEIDQLPHVDFRAEILGNSARFFSHLS